MKADDFKRLKRGSRVQMTSGGHRYVAIVQSVDVGRMVAWVIFRKTDGSIVERKRRYEALDRSEQHVNTMPVDFPLSDSYMSKFMESVR